MLGFGLMLNHSPVYDALGIVVGHIYYWLEDVYLPLSGRRVLKTPSFLYVPPILYHRFCFVLLCFVCFVLFCFVLFCFVLFCFVLFCFVLFCFVLFCFVLFCFVLLFY